MVTLQQLKRFMNFAVLPGIGHICFMLNIFQLWPTANAEIPCKHTMPDVNGWFLVPLNDTYYCGCNEGEFMESVDKWQNSTECKRCPFDPSIPAKQTYMNEGPHLNRECKPAVVNCADGKVRMNGNRCFPAKCVPQDWVQDYKIPECRGFDQSSTEQANDQQICLSVPLVVASIVIFVLIVFLLLCIVCKVRSKRNKPGVNEDGTALNRISVRPLSDTSPESLESPEERDDSNPLLQPKQSGCDHPSVDQNGYNGRPQSDRTPGHSMAPETSNHSCISTHPRRECPRKEYAKKMVKQQVKKMCSPFAPPAKTVSNMNGADGMDKRTSSDHTEPKECFGNRRNDKLVVEKIKFALSREISIQDATMFFRIFGASSDDLDFYEKYKRDRPEWFIRVFEKCENTCKGQKICRENIENYFRKQNLPDLYDIVRKVIDEFETDGS